MARHRAIRERGNKPVQTITLEIPAVTLNIPGGTNGANVDFGLRLPPALTNKDDAGVWTNGTAFRAIDQVRSLEYVGGEVVRATKTAALPYGNPAQEGDLRLAMIRPVLGPDDFAPRDWASWKLPDLKLVHGLRTGWGAPMSGFDQGAKGSVYAAGGTQRGGKPFLLPVGVGAGGVRRLPRSGSDAGGPGEYDRGLSKHVDGSFGGKVDEGNVYYGYTDNNEGGRLPYYRGRAIEETGQSFFTPNRQLPSAVMFGSLPSGGLEGRPWETLLFRPDRPANLTSVHPGARFPEDHLLLDLFHLPIIEPYAISEPFSTAGKINLNYIMAPYGYAPGTGTFGKDKVANS